MKKGKEEEFTHLMFEKGENVYRIGEIHSGQDVILQNDKGSENISFQGYEH